MSIEKFKQEAKEKGFIYLENGSKPKHHLYACQHCGEQKEFIPTKLRARQPVCQSCIEKRFSAEALEKGLKLLGKGKKPKHKLYQFIKCGHTKEYETNKVRNINPVCEICLKEKFKKEAALKGLTLIGDSKKHGYYLYQFNDCGHTKELRPDCVNRSQACCDICGDSYHSNKSNIYLLKIFKNNKSFIKLGVAQNANTRIKNYKLKEGYSVETLLEVPFNTHSEAIKVEKKLHTKYRPFNLDKNIMKNIMQSGFTECYPNKIQNTLISELCNI